jgi:hypothetical protein
LPEDVKYCHCPRNSERNFAEGKRSQPPKKEEINADSEAHIDRLLSGEFDFDEDRRLALELTDKYYAKIGRTHPAWTLVGRRQSDISKLRAT